MNVGWLLKSSTLWGALGFSGALSMAILLFSPGGWPSLSKREAELKTYRHELLQKARRNRELLEEVQRLAAKDPELLEALARKHGFQRPGEKVYTFREPREKP